MVPSIVWLAVADARGHLMRAHLAARALAPLAQVRIVTTSREGQRFLAALGRPSTVLSQHWGVRFLPGQHLDRRRTEREGLRYLCDPRQGHRDWRVFCEISRGASLIVNDFHPLLLAASSLPAPLVHVHGLHLWDAILAQADDRPRLAPLWRALLEHRVRASFARICHTPLADHALRFDPQHASWMLPPLLDRPQQSRDEVRCRLGCGSRPLAAVYLNPHFDDPRLAFAIEHAVEACGMDLYAVGEGFGSRSGWRAYDGRFVDVAAAADVLLAAPGMGAVGLARRFGLPLVAIITPQPEQLANAQALQDSGHPMVAMPIEAVARDLEGALAALTSGGPMPASLPEDPDVLWRDLLVRLLLAAMSLHPPRQERDHVHAAYDRFGARDQQPPIAC